MISKYEKALNEANLATDSQGKELEGQPNPHFTPEHLNP
jgi:hypothetical protein